MKRPAMAPKSSDSQPSVPGNGLPDKAVSVKIEPGADGKYPAIPRNEAVAMNKRLSKMRKAGRTDLPEAYEKCHTQQEKRVFFYTQYQLDPEVAKRKVTKTDEDSEKHLTEVEPGWWTKEQIAEAKGILPTCENFKALADASIAGLQERPHEDNNLAALGVKQYYYTKVKNKVLGEKKRKLTAEETVEDPELGDFNAMRDALHGGFQAKTIGGSKPGQEMALTAGTQQEVAKEITKEEAYKLGWKKVKTALNSVVVEVGGLDMVRQQLEAVSGKQHQKLKCAYLDQLEKATAKLKDMQKAKVAEFVAFPGKGSDVEENLLETKTQDLKKLLDSVVEGHKDMKRQLAPIKKWVASPN